MTDMADLLLDRVGVAFTRLNERYGFEIDEATKCCATCTVASFKTDLYAYYHHQDRERVEEGDTYLFIGFGQMPEIVAGALVAAGLRVTWNGEPGQRIHVALP